jgi:hypothetical protein
MVQLNSLSSGRVVLVVALFAAPVLATARAEEPPALSERQELPAVRLRGYGTVSGTLRQAADSSSSVLEIRCESEAKARIVQAKFLSDLGLLPGVTRKQTTTHRGKLGVSEVVGQGSLAAVRGGAKVFVFAAPTGAALAALYERQFPPATAGLSSEADAQVPMYLDRWDRYGFRFYYAPWMRPKLPNGRDDEAYDPAGDFTFARESDHSGVVLWTVPNSVGTAEGVANVPDWDWALRQAHENKLPVGVNLSIGDPRWMLNRYPEQVIQRQPQYAGAWYGIVNFGINDILSWCSPQAQDVQLAQMQKTMREVAPYNDSITSWLEPHGELSHSPCDLLIDYGPDADKSYRRFLKTRYPTIAEVSKRYTGAADALHSWDQVRVPELASFLGWGPDALDLAGVWKISYDAPFKPASAAPDLDDSKWPTLTAPGHQIIVHLPRKPAVFRRQIDVAPAWRAAHPRVWLYLWDLNDTRPNPSHPSDVLVYVNGQLIVESPARREEGHWAMLEVTKALKDGKNSFALMLPQGCLVYRTYLSPNPPREYPNLGPQLNARWADFSDWIAWTREQVVYRAAQGIRQVDPDRPIVFMSPTDYQSGVKRACQDYGGVFHDTGAMAGFWNDYNPMLMSGAGLPSDCEPGSGAVDLPDFKRFMGRWITEGTQGVDYFQHMGDVLWKPEVKQYFSRSQPLWHLIGKYHSPDAQVALLTSDRVARLTGFPWGYDPNTVLRGGQWQWRLADLLRTDYPRDLIDESDFAPGGNAGKYRVIIDENTTIMDPPLLDGIERFVRAGGVFVTYVQTGRHTSAEKDSWPISKLTGYSVVAIDPHGPDGQVRKSRKLRAAVGQEIFRGDWSGVNDGNGLTLKKDLAECQDLLLWSDGGVAAGIRRLGKGAVIHLGVKFAHDRGAGNVESTMRVLNDVLRWAGVRRSTATAAGVLMSHFVSNNGLYDVWTMWNDHDKDAVAELHFREGLKPASCMEVGVNAAAPIDAAGGAAELRGLKFAPWQTRVFLTPRQELAQAPLRWFALQRSWWRGTADAGPPVPPLEQKLALDLTADWRIKPLDNLKSDAAPLLGEKTDDADWDKRPLGILSVGAHEKVRRAVLRKRFTVPANWKGGRVAFWLLTDGANSFVDAGRLFLDGREAWNGRGDGPADLDFDGALLPGSTHLLAIEVKGTHPLMGVRAGAWLAFTPKPRETFDLAGDWSPSSDGLHFGAPVALPGRLNATMARRSVVVPEGRPGRNVVLHAATEGTHVRGLLVNGRWIPRTNPYMGASADFNVTPFVHLGRENEFILVTVECVVRDVAIHFYEKGEFP